MATNIETLQCIYSPQTIESFKRYSFKNISDARRKAVPTASEMSVQPSCLVLIVTNQYASSTVELNLNTIKSVSSFSISKNKSVQMHF